MSFSPHPAELECEALKERRGLIHRMRFIRTLSMGKDLELAEGTEEELMQEHSVLSGIVNEYRDGGDQMVENCTCGMHRDKYEEGAPPPDYFEAEHLWVGLTGEGGRQDKNIVLVPADAPKHTLLAVNWDQARSLAIALLQAAELADRG